MQSFFKLNKCTNYNGMKIQKGSVKFLQVMVIKRVDQYNLDKALSSIFGDPLPNQAR